MVDIWLSPPLAASAIRIRNEDCLFELGWWNGSFPMVFSDGAR
jgi:hypothetical protein